jgi:ribosomal protein S18 acetylase RimI-like enzyme
VIETRAATADDLTWVVEAAREVLGDDYQVHSTRQFRVTEGEVIVGMRDGRRAGFLTWVPDGDGAEFTAVACTERRAGVGAALLRAGEEAARARGARRVFLVTTDDNDGAQRFYERNGWEMVERRVGAVDLCRVRYKPTIPADAHDELVYERPC